MSGSFAGENWSRGDGSGADLVEGNEGEREKCKARLFNLFQSKFLCYVTQISLVGENIQSPLVTLLLF